MRTRPLSQDVGTATILVAPRTPRTRGCLLRTWTETWWPLRVLRQIIRDSEPGHLVFYIHVTDNGQAWIPIQGSGRNGLRVVASLPMNENMRAAAVTEFTICLWRGFIGFEPPFTLDPDQLI